MEQQTCPNTDITTLEQAELILRREGIVKNELVEGVQLLEICGFSLTNTAVRIREQIERHQFVEGRDFSRTSEKSTGGRPKTVFQFTVNAANHVLLGAMTPEGKKARQKAIDREIVSQSEYPGMIAAMDEQFGSALPAPGITPHQLLEMNMDASLKAMTFVKTFGIEGNQAMLAADRLVKTQIDFSPLEAMGQPTLIAPVKAPLFSVTELGKLSNPVYSAVNMNLKLQDAGMQLRTGQHWTPTEKGRPFCEMLDVGKHHGDGTPIKQLKWYQTVLDHLVPKVSAVKLADPEQEPGKSREGQKVQPGLTRKSPARKRGRYQLDNHFSIFEIADELELTKSHVVSVLVKHRVIKWKGKDKAGKYILTAKGWNYGLMYDPRNEEFHDHHSKRLMTTHCQPVFGYEVLDLF